MYFHVRKIQQISDLQFAQFKTMMQQHSSGWKYLMERLLLEYAVSVKTNYYVGSCHFL